MTAAAVWPKSVRTNVAVVGGGTTLFWAHADHLKRPVKMLDAAQNVVWEALYEPFGTVHSITGTAANDNRFPGQLFQLETGLAYNWHRRYDSMLGRYTQVDPLGLTAMLSAGPSVYGYVGQSPLMYVDPEGGMGRGSAAGKLPANCSCPPVPDHPPGAYVNDNMCLSKKKDVLTPWFYNQVSNKAPWDCKQQGAQYQDFGNFNYGVTDRAGEPLAVCLKERPVGLKCRQGHRALIGARR